MSGLQQKLQAVQTHIFDYHDRFCECARRRALAI